VVGGIGVKLEVKKSCYGGECGVIRSVCVV
jgi:hypothetical protein